MRQPLNRKKTICSPKYLIVIGYNIGGTVSLSNQTFVGSFEELIEITLATFNVVLLHVAHGAVAVESLLISLSFEAHLLCTYILWPCDLSSKK